jgi:hypothetical protein
VERLSIQPPTKRAAIEFLADLLIVLESPDRLVDVATGGGVRRPCDGHWAQNSGEEPQWERCTVIRLAGAVSSGRPAAITTVR